MNKKGDINIPVIILVLFIAVLFLFFSSFLFNKFSVAVGNEPAFNNTQVQSSMSDTNKAFGNLDNTIFFLFIGFVILLIVSSYLIRTNPIFMVIMIILLFLITMFSFIISNTYQGMIEGGGEFGTYSQDTYPITDFIFTNLPLLFFIVDIFSLIAMFAKSSGGNV